MMDSDIFFKFINEQVKLTWNNGFILFGKIIDVSDDFIVFETTQKKSIINKAEIKEVIQI